MTTSAWKPQSQDEAAALVAGYTRYQVAYQHQTLTDAEMLAFCLRNSLDAQNTPAYNLAYLTGWLVGLARITPPPGGGQIPPAPLESREAPMSPRPAAATGTVFPLMRLGYTFLVLTQGEAFCTGYQTGHLSCMLACRKPQRAPEPLIPSLVAASVVSDDVAIRQAGFVCGWLLTAYRQQGRSTAPGPNVSSSHVTVQEERADLPPLPERSTR